MSASARWVWRVALGLAVLLTVMCGLLLAGVRQDDRKIEADPQATPAEVVFSSWTQVVVRYTSVVPPSQRTNNLLSSGGVYAVGRPQTGQGVLVEYSRSDPTLVRVAGRGLGWSALRVAVFLTVLWSLLAALKLTFWRRARSSR